MSAALIALLVAGCNGTTNTTAATTSTTRTTETFSGTVTVGGSDVHSFTVAATGAIDVMLTSAAPATVVMGIDVGLPADGKCSALAGASTTASAGTTVQLSGLATAGTLCVDVHDAGSQSEAVNYTISVTHP